MSALGDKRLDDFLDAYSAWRSAPDADYGKKKKEAWEKLEVAAELYIRFTPSNKAAVEKFMLQLEAENIK